MSAAKITPPLSVLVNIPGWQQETLPMSAGEVGALLRLKMHVWRTGPIPDNDRALSRIVGMDSKEWREARKTIEPLFIVMHGEWQREDWNDELEAAYEAVRKAKEKSKKGHDARWKRNATGNAPGNAPGNASGVLKYTATSKPPSQGGDVYRPGDDAVPPEWLDDLRTAEDSFLAGDGAVTTEVGRESGTAGGGV